MLFIKKNNGKFCMCIYYQDLNKVTIKKKYMLVRIDDLFNQIQEVVRFLKINLRSKYYQLTIRNKDYLKPPSD